MRGRPVQQQAVELALTSAPARRILAACIRKPLSVRDIARSAEVPLASCYRQVKALLDSDMLVVERSALTEDGKAYDLYRARIRLARIEVRADRVDVTWEANAAIEDRIIHLWGQLGA